MSSYGLTCEFPMEEFAALTDLESLDLSANFDLTVGAFTAMLSEMLSPTLPAPILCAHQGLMFQ